MPDCVLPTILVLLHRSIRERRRVPVHNTEVVQITACTYVVPVSTFFAYRYCPRVIIVPLFVCRRRMSNVTLVLAQHSKLKMDKKARRRGAAIERRAHSLPPRTMYRRRVCLVRSSIQGPSGSRVGTERSFRARGPSKSASATTMQSSAACGARGVCGSLNVNCSGPWARTEH